MKKRRTSAHHNGLLYVEVRGILLYINRNITFVVVAIYLEEFNIYMALGVVELGGMLLRQTWSSKPEEQSS